ncbi:helix-turn-helix domain-containing protein [Lacticaseibacillus songhuajiangensis]|jgi:hypothetical protein|uniref:helix-turn-helix domain-containing protein n=1 Tax=Lacticaseibacillus songhuajiangensis TaxID=1296539 RepID=UPI000F78F43F|nr:helix-turn-helix transcriptional regulator [Lacticaseibacillus songhuajiangensis]
MATQTLNALVKHLRHDRGVTLEDIRGDWSVASMSRFEHGDIELADSVIAQMAIPLGLDYEDLIYRLILSEDNLEDWRYLASEDWNEENAVHLLTQLNALKVPGMRNDFLAVATAVIKELLSIHDEGRQNMAPEVVAQLDQYLANITEFSRLEGMLFSLSLEYVPLATGWQWVARQIKMMDKLAVEPQVIRRVISFCAAIGERAAIERQLDIMGKATAEMRCLTQTIPENAMQRYNLVSLEALHKDFADPSPANHAHLIAVMKAGALIFAPEVHQSIVQYTIAQGWATAEDFQ